MITIREEHQGTDKRQHGELLQGHGNVLECYRLYMNSMEAIPVPIQNVTWYVKNTTIPSIRIAANFSWLLAGSVKNNPLGRCIIKFT